MRATIAIALSLLLAANVCAVDNKDLVKAELLTDVSSVKPGDSFNVGVLLHIKPEWHIYWTNPGESGMATDAKIKVDKANVGEVQFPIPTTFIQPGNIIGYGYVDEVMLIATVEVPQNAKLGSTLDVSMDTKWLCCHDICVQGGAKLHAKVDVAAETKKQNEEKFDRWRAAMPKIATQAVEVKNVMQTIDQSTAPTKAKGKLHIAIAWNKSPTSVEVYLPASPTASFETESTENGDKGTNLVIAFEAKTVDKAEKTPPQAVLVYNSDGKRYGLVIPLEIDRPLLPESATRPTADATK